MNTPPQTYAVGHGRPPVHTRWKKGQCGNPRRIRKRTAKPVVAMVDEFFAKEIAVVENGTSVRRSAFEVILLRLCYKAMAGSTRALTVLAKYREFAKSRNGPGGLKVEWVDDAEYLAYLKEMAGNND